MITLNSFLDSYNKIKQTEGEKVQYSESDIVIVSDFLTGKFREAYTMFGKFDQQAIIDFIKISSIKDFIESQKVFVKDQPCKEYLFILYGDINFYEEDNKENQKLIKTVSAGTIYGHKIKEKYRFFSKSKGQLSLLTVEKELFDQLIESINKRKQSFKLNFIKKFFPNLRLFSDDVLLNIMQFFLRETYEKNEKIFVDGEYDEFIYVIISGLVGISKKVNKIGISNTNLITTDENTVSYFILDKFSRGDVFGIYSALKNNKCNYTATVLEKTELYKISKSHLLYYFGGNNGFIPKNLKSLDSFQQMSNDMKINYIKQVFLKNPDPSNNKFNQFLSGILVHFPKQINPTRPTSINESIIENPLKDAWKSLENLDSKLSAFKNALLSGNTKKSKNLDIFGKIQDVNEKRDLTKISGDATNRVLGRKLKAGFNNNQLRSIDKLNSICGVKKEQNEDLKKLLEISNKMEGKKTNRLTDFGEDKKEDEKMKNIDIEEKKPQKSEEEQKKENIQESTHDTEKKKISQETSNQGKKDESFDPLLERAKARRAKLNLKNLI